MPSEFDFKQGHVPKAEGDGVIVLSGGTEFVGCEIPGESDMDDAGCRVTVADGSCSEQHLGGDVRLTRIMMLSNWQPLRRRMNLPWQAGPINSRGLQFMAIDG